MNLLIHDAKIVLSNGKILKDGAIAIERNRITDVGNSSQLKSRYGRGYEKIDAKNCVVIPGLVNTHQHAAMSLLRGYADDLPLKEWLEKWIWPVEKLMTPHDIYVGALLTAIESVMSGTTTVNTMYYYSPKENEAKAFAEAGLRGVIGHPAFSWTRKKDEKTLEAFANVWHNRADGLIRISISPHAPYTVDPEYLKTLNDMRKNLNEKYDSKTAPIILHIHVAETSDEPEKIKRAFKIKAKRGVVEYLDSLGILGKHVIAAHCVALTRKDIALLKSKNVKVAHNPISNLKLASGVSPVPKMLKEGITVSLGTDSPCSNNNADMFDVMKTAAILHKGISRNPTVLPAEQVLAMATTNGAKALSWEKEIGSIKIGKKADLAIINFRKPHLTPLHNIASHLVYAAKGADVETVIINGKMVMENREVKTLDVEKVMEMAEKTKDALLQKLNANVK
jgi:5-methylthioadenosine/S-adenosylhomocysteine deaminase